MVGIGQALKEVDFFLARGRKAAERSLRTFGWFKQRFRWKIRISALPRLGGPSSRDQQPESSFFQIL
jgi:hypothetical protein